MLQFNVANPQAGAMKVYDIDDEKKLAHVYGMRMGQEIEGEKLSDEFKGYVFRYGHATTQCACVCCVCGCLSHVRASGAGTHTTSCACTPC